MPELPEVETVVRGLRTPLIGRTVQQVMIERPGVVRGQTSANELADRLVGQTFRAIDRRAKYILCQFDHDTLVVHLKMTGRLYVTPDAAVHDADRWLRATFQLDAGQQLRFSDARRFGFVAVTADVATLIPALGPEPLGEAFTTDYLIGRLPRHRKAIKALLLDQDVAAGVGNIYADEGLFMAGLHPLRSAASLSADEIVRLHTALREALQLGIEREGASVNWYRNPDGTSGHAQKHFFVYDRAGQPCLRCGTTIEKIRVAQRGTHYCPACQPLKE